MAKNQMYILAERIARNIIAEQTQARLQVGFDAAVIAANRVFHMGPGRAEAFGKAYNEAANELADLYVRDRDENHDRAIEWGAAMRDKEILRIVGEKNFVPLGRAYGGAYFDEYKRIRLTVREVYIPVEEKLPPEPMDILAKTESGYAIVRWDGKRFLVMGKNPRELEGVIAWMALPK